MKKRLSVLIVGGVLAVSPLAFQGTASAGTVRAHPTGCTAQKFLSDSVEATCSKSNGGHYKAIANCKVVVGGQEFSREAAVWKSSGLSIVHCPAGTYVISAGVMTKAS